MKIHKMISRFNQSSRHGSKVKYIVIHYVGAISSARNNCIYFSGGDRQASAHYFVDDEIWQCIPEGKAAWHCGGGLQDTGTAMNGGNRGAQLHGICTNSNSIGIELCCHRKNGRIVPTPTAIRTAAPLVQTLMKKYDVPASRVVRHFDVTGKYCPNGYIAKSSWAGLRRALTGVKPTAYPTVTLAKGSQGTQVVKLQRCLNKILKAGLETDGIFGVLTDKAVRRFQKKYSLEVDGIVGPKTRAKIKKLMK
ncbi:MAG: N-acetylmuramoyl-L-alanine amidase [Eubacteriaceae bacterium]|nr:N-acetylmuramoyl-L-alanine amidase [Eubacteriaceae bacterium]